MKLTTTLNRIKAHNPSHAEWTQLLSGPGKRLTPHSHSPRNRAHSGE